VLFCEQCARRCLPLMSNVRPHEHMSGLRVVLAFVAGALLYYIAVVYLGGVLAAVGVSKSYFAFFGRERAELALALLSLVSWALPVVVAVAFGAFVLLRAWRGSLRSCTWGLGLGMLSCFLYWHASSASSMAGHPNSTLSFTQAFTSTLLPVWWAAPSVFAPWVGLVLAVWLTARQSRGGAAREV
jgi:hypothetical protein